jgi:hypothetical protein
LPHFVAFPDGLHIDGAIKFGRAVSVFGFIVGSILWIELVLFLFVRVPKLDLHLKVIQFSCFIMAILSLLLFVGLASDHCEDSVNCSPRGASTAILAFIVFVASGALMIYFDRKKKISA